MFSRISIMGEFSEGLKAELSTTTADELRTFIADKTKEAQDKELAMRATLENLIRFLAEMEQSSKAKVEEWQRENARIEAAIQADLRNMEENIHLDQILLTRLATTLAEKAEMERQKLSSLPLAKEHQRIVSLLEKEFDYDYDSIMLNDPERAKRESENWTRWTQERVDSTLKMALTVAAIKQKWLQQLKSQAEKWMVINITFTYTSHLYFYTQHGGKLRKCFVCFPQVSVPQVSDGPAQEVNDTHIKLSLDDGLQSLSFSSQKAEQVVVQNQMLQAKIDAKFDKKMARLVAEAIKKEEKIRAAELKKRRQMEEKTRKKLEEIQKAELKEKKRREAKEKKEAEKMERRRAKEERGETTQPRFCFCFRKSSRESLPRSP
ncbi:uncharacterized protein LOC121723383 [Alosa sapidissima]|uniref:uncharacterized protein LOC121723383 n=1 Tax=Alosa sapidissima TaxID=34773 RepID=UPI001C0865F3|nr:uncharacterized protein LOC121723383 [Alosa sapidissima]